MGLPRALRLRAGREIRRVFEAGRSTATRWVALHWVANGLDRTRVAVVAGRRVGKAVRRNRVRRLLREAIRRRADRLPAGYDLVLVARGAAAAADLAQLTDALDMLLERMRREV